MKNNDLLGGLLICFAAVAVFIGGSQLGLFNTSVLINLQVLVVIEAIILIAIINVALYNSTIPSQERLHAVLVFFFTVSLGTTAAIAYITQNNTYIAGAIFVTTLLYSVLSTLENKDKSGNSIIKANAYPYWKDIAFWSVLALFVGIRVSIIVYYKGGYLDEYLHIFTGASWFDSNFHEIYKGIEYYRGIYLTILSAFSFKLFGFSFFAQKAIPLLISILNFTAFYHLSKRFITQRPLHIFAMIAYTLTPVLIFNATYIRTYIFFELFAYVAIFLVSRLVFLYEQSKWKSFWIFSTISLFFLAFIIITRDVESLLFLLLFGVAGLTYIFITRSKITPLSFLPGLKIPHGTFLLPIVFILPFINVSRYVDIFLNGQLSHGGGSVEKFVTFFFVDNIVITTLFIALWVRVMWEKNVERKVLLATFSILFIFHNIITPDFRTLRGIFYFFPLMIIGAFSVLDSIKIQYKTLFLGIALVIAISPLYSYRQYLEKGPGIPKEIDYFPFGDYYTKVAESCKDRKIISMMHSNYISNFYGIKPHYIIYLRQEQLLLDERYYKGNAGVFYQSVDDVPVLSSYFDVEQIVKNEKVCVLVTTDFRHTGLYISGNDYSSLLSTTTEEITGALKVLKN